MTTEKEFAQDWHDMGGKDIREVNLNYHGSNQALHLDWKNEEYITSTGTGKTNKSGADGLDVNALPSIMGNVKNAQLNINSCHSNKKDGSLKGQRQTLMQAFYNCFDFKTVRGTSHVVSYGRFYKRPHPGHGWNIISSWDFLPETNVNSNFTDYIGCRK